MKRMVFLIAGLLATAYSTTLCGQQYYWQDSTKSLESRVEWLVGKLTLDEKLSLMVHQNPAIPRLGLPAYSWWNEALHGVGRAGLATVYPMPIALAATFRPQWVQNRFSDVAAEARRKYHEAQDTGFYGDYAGLTFFTPNINIFRDPRWGRGMETYGEDPYLTARMGLACVEGLQHGWEEDWQGRPLLTAACLKHFAVHSGPEGTRHEFDSRVSQRDLRTTYLPAFEYIIKKSDVRQVMCGYNRLNGSPCCTNRELFDILRNEWHYDGLLVTDCWALNDAYETDTVIPRHRTHATAALAYGDAFGREVDLECGSGLPALREAVEQGLVPESKVDEHVRRILRTRLEVTDEPKASEDETCREPVIYGIERASMVLLKNENTLPLARGTKIYLEGPNAIDTLMPLGNYNGTPRHTVSIREGLQTAHDGKGNTLQLVSTADQADVIVYAGGLSPQLEGEELQVDEPGFYRGDRTQIELPAYQVSDIKRLRKSGKPIVLLLCTGSALGLEEVVDEVDAILVAWYGGENMGSAVAWQLCPPGGGSLFGRLPVTFYRNTRQLPPFDDYAMQGRTYRYMDAEPLFPFGYGLDYAFCHMVKASFDPATLTVSATVHADSSRVRPGHASPIIQVYLKNPSDPDNPRKQLVGVAEGHLFVGQNDDVSIPLEAFWFRQYNPATGRMEEPADGTRMTLQVGFSSNDKDLVDIPFTYRRR